MNYETLTLQINEFVAEVALNQVKSANAMNRQAWDELEEVFISLNSNADVHVIILSGEGKHFCAGIDLQLLGSIQKHVRNDGPATASEKIRQLILKLQKPINEIENCRKPVLAAIQGGCIGAGLDIVAACDMRYCTQESFFTIKEIDMAMVADLGSLQRLPKILSQGILREMAFTGRNVYADEALKIGLVNRIFDSKEIMMSEVRKMATEIAKKSSLAIRGAKTVLNHSRENSVAQGLEYVATWNAGMLISEDLKEAILAFQEKRPPSFNKKSN